METKIYKPQQFNLSGLNGISDKGIADLNVPTGSPLVYELGPDMRPAASESTTIAK